jgi:hypothetical protein
MLPARSAPAENALSPAPVMTMTLVSLSFHSCVIALSSSSRTSGEIVLSLSGLLRTSFVIPPSSFSIFIVLNSSSFFSSLASALPALSISSSFPCFNVSAGSKIFFPYCFASSSRRLAICSAPNCFASSKGPKGLLSPSLTAVSMSCGVATPISTSLTASFISTKVKSIGLTLSVALLESI